MTGHDWLVWGPLDWQSRGQGFESPQLHLKSLVTGGNSRLWVLGVTGNVHYPFGFCAFRAGLLSRCGCLLTHRLRPTRLRINQGMRLLGHLWKWIWEELLSFQLASREHFSPVAVPFHYEAVHVAKETELRSP